PISYFVFTHPSPPYIYTLSLHDALPILALITDILDLSKIESGTMVVEPGEVRFTDLSVYVSKTFRHVADGRGLDQKIELDQHLPDRKSTRLNSSHLGISYAVFCLKKKSK